jgi:phage baseplate assembly protein W
MSSQLSDFNKGGQRAIPVSSRQLFADLNLSMPIHPKTNDIVPLTDLDAVKQSVKNLVLTNFGEKLFRPDFGGNVTSYLFEPVNYTTAISIQEEIKQVLQNFEPRVSNIVVQVDNDIDTNSYRVTIGFSIKNTALPRQEVEFELNRIR